MPSKPMNSTDAKIACIVIAVAALIGDTLASWFGWCSISAYVRTLDVATGGWLRWIMVGLLLHWFAPPPFGGWRL